MSLGDGEIDGAGVVAIGVGLGEGLGRCVAGAVEALAVGVGLADGEGEDDRRTNSDAVGVGVVAACRCGWAGGRVVEAGTPATVGWPNSTAPVRAPVIALATPRLIVVERYRPP